MMFCTIISNVTRRITDVISFIQIISNKQFSKLTCEHNGRLKYNGILSSLFITNIEILCKKKMFLIILYIMLQL